MPCAGNHIFHTDCINMWMKMNNKCPLCFEDIDIKKCKAFKKHFNKKNKRKVNAGSIDSR